MNFLDFNPIQSLDGPSQIVKYNVIANYHEQVTQLLTIVESKS